MVRSRQARAVAWYRPGMKKRSRDSKAPRVAEEAASADTETDELSALPEELQIRILQDLDEPRDCFNLSLASARLGLWRYSDQSNGRWRSKAAGIP